MDKMNEIRERIEEIELEQSMCPANSSRYNELEATIKTLTWTLKEMFENWDYQED